MWYIFLGDEDMPLMTRAKVGATPL